MEREGRSRLGASVLTTSAAPTPPPPAPVCCFHSLYSHSVREFHKEGKWPEDAHVPGRGPSSPHLPQDVLPQPEPGLSSDLMESQYISSHKTVLKVISSCWPSGTCLKSQNSRGGGRWISERGVQPCLYRFPGQIG